jgi:hypothetical protein
LIESTSPMNRAALILAVAALISLSLLPGRAISAGGDHDGAGHDEDRHDGDGTTIAARDA